MEGGSIPQWAHSFLQDIEQEGRILRERHLELKTNIDKKMISFEDLKSKKEAEMRLKLHLETTHYNNLITKKKESNKGIDSRTLNSKDAMMVKIQQIDKQYEQHLEEMKRLKSQEEALIRNIKEAKLKETTLNLKLQTLHKQSGLQFSADKMKQQYPNPPDIHYLLEDKLGASKSRSTHTEIARMVLDNRRAAVFDLAFHSKKQFIVALLKSKESIGEPHFQNILYEMIRLYEYYGKEMELFDFIFQYEINHSKGPNDLLKKDNASTKVFELYGTKCASNYLKDTIRSYVLRIIQDDKAHIIDPDQIPPGEDLKTNIIQLKTYASQILKSLSASVQKIPFQFKLLTDTMKQAVTRRYPNEWSRILSFHIFTFIAQAIGEPEKHNLEVSDIGLNSRRCLRCVARIIEYVSVGIHFQEEHMLPLNEVVSESIGIVKKYTLDICKQSDHQTWSTLVPSHSQIVIGELIKHFQELSPLALNRVMEELNLLDSQIFKHKCSFFQHELLSISTDQLLGIPSKSFVLENHFVMGFIEFIVDKDQSFLDAITTMVSQKMIDGAKVSKLVVPLLLYRDQSGERIESLLRNVMRKEMLSLNQGGSKSGTHRMLGGFGAQLYCDYASLVSRKFLSSIVTLIIELFRKRKIGKLEKKSLSTFKSIVDVICESLSKLPKSIWRIHNFFSKQLLDIGIPFMLQYLIIPCLENLEELFPGHLTPREMEKYKTKINYITDFLHSIASSQPIVKADDKHTQEITQFMKSVETEIGERVDSWISNADAEFDASNHKLTWSEVRTGLIALLTQANSDYESFEVVLSKQVEKDIFFSLQDLFWAISQKPGLRTNNLELRLSNATLQMNIKKAAEEK